MGWPVKCSRKCLGNKICKGAGQLGGTCAGEHAAHERALAGPVGRCQAAGAAVLVHRRARQHRQRRLTARAAALKHRYGTALAAPIAVRRLIKRLAAAHRRERLQSTENRDQTLHRL